MPRRTKGYAGDVSPKRASRILRQRSDAVLLDIRDLRQVSGEPTGAALWVAGHRIIWPGGGFDGFDIRIGEGDGK